MCLAVGPARSILRSEADRKLFLDLLSRPAGGPGGRLRLCLMDNHFSFGCGKTPRGNLSTGMQIIMESGRGCGVDEAWSHAGPGSS